MNNILNNIYNLGVKIKKAKTWKADTLKVCPIIYNTFGGYFQ